MGGVKISFAILAAAVTAIQANAAIIVSTNFDSYTPLVGTPAGNDVSALFTEANSGGGNTSFVDAGGGNIVLTQSAGGTGTSNSSASIASANSNFSTAGGFRISTTFSISAYTLGTGGVVNVSLSAFGTSTDLGSGNAYRLIYTLSGSSPGTLALQEVGGTLVANATGSITPIVSPPGSQSLTLTLEGIYTSPTALSLTGTITNGTNTLTLTGNDTSIGIANGNNFGVRTALNGNGATSSETITFSNFSLETIPEPTSIALLGTAIGVLGVRRKRA